MRKSLPLLILTGVDLAGKSYISKRLMEKFPDIFYIAKKFTTIKSLANSDDNMYYYIEKPLFKENTMDSEIFSLKKISNKRTISEEKLKTDGVNYNLKDDHNDVDYILYMKDPIKSIVSSNKICILNMNYSEFLRYIQNEKMFKSYNINVIPDNPVMLADRIFNHKYKFLINKTNGDSTYDELISEVEYNRKMITYFYKSKLFTEEIVNNYTNNIPDFETKLLSIMSLYPEIDFKNSTSKNGGKVNSKNKSFTNDIDVLKKFKF